ncbi:MAG: DUF3021 domain-containing protein [Clostridia bacterium]|nr:DUF3021 domain-containing protein [Clostridia bacterium]
MNRYLKEFLHRGLIFGGFGPIIVGIVFAILSVTLDSFEISGFQILLAIVSTYLLAFVQAGSSVFNQIEHWPIAKSLFVHFITQYVAYTGCYIINSWIPFEMIVLAIFSLVFIVTYLIIWFSVYFAVKITGKRLNQKL